MEQVTFRPSPEEVMNKIVPAYIEGFVYGALVESYSCEQNARMMAMEAATTSAKDMLQEVKRALQPRKTGSNYSGNYRGNRMEPSPQKNKK